MSAFPTITQGTDAQTRLGSRISIHSLHVKMYTFLASLEGQTAPINQIQTRVVVGINIDGGATVAANVMDTGVTDILKLTIRGFLNV